MDWNGNAGWGGWIAMLITMLVFWGGLIVVIAFLVRQPGQGTGQPPRQDRPDPKTILEERFARGEITKDELEEGRRVLRGDS